MVAVAHGPAATTRRGRARQRIFRHPGWVVLAGFLVAIGIGTVLLSLPAATADGRRTGFVDALFTATSAITVTGLTTVDTATHWSSFGDAVILVLIQLGGLGILTSASLFFMIVARRIGLRRRLAAQMEVRALELGGLRRLILLIVAVTLAIEAIVSTILFLRFWIGYDHDVTTALWHGVFHGVAAFNNAGFSLYPGSLIPFSGDPAILVPIALAVIIGGLGFPVWAEMYRRPGPLARWSIHTKITLSATAVLLVLGMLAMTVFEWDNPDTLGDRSFGARLLDGMFTGVMPRTAGFGVMDYNEAGQDTLLGADILMMIGGGSGGTAGGLKVTTVALLALIVWAELRGDRQVVAFRRHIPETVQRQALTIATLLIATVTIGTLALVMASGLPLGVALSEVIAATSTTGFSVGTSAQLGDVGKMVLVPLMLIGRIGPLALGSTLILRETQRRFSRPDERIMVV